MGEAMIPAPLTLALPYPAQTLPNDTFGAYDELMRTIQAPDALIAMSLLSAMATAAQGIADVQLPCGHIRPLSLNTLSIAESGERKTTVDNLVFAPFYKADRETIASLGSADAKKTLRLHRWLRQDITPRALMEALHGDGTSIVVNIDEGDTAFKSQTLRALGMLNKAWDGTPLLTNDRADLAHLCASNPRLSVNLMTQSAPLLAYLQRKGPEIRGTGFWARCLVGWPQSTRGYRLNVGGQEPLKDLARFHERLKVLIARYPPQSNTRQRRQIRFSDHCLKTYNDYANHFEFQLRNGSFFCDVPDAASKAMEIIARIAGVFAVFADDSDIITLNNLTNAYYIFEWHIGEFKRIFSRNFELEKHIQQSDAVFKYICENASCQPDFSGCIRHAIVRRNGPVRDGKAFTNIINTLKVQNRIYVKKENNGLFILIPPQTVYLNQPMPPMQPMGLQNYWT